MGWKQTVIEQRSQIRRLLKDSPSLRRQVPGAIAEELVEARTLASLDLVQFGEQPLTDPGTLAFTEDQVLVPGCRIDGYPESEPISTRTPGPIVELSDTFCT